MARGPTAGRLHRSGRGCAIRKRLFEFSDSRATLAGKPLATDVSAPLIQQRSMANARLCAGCRPRAPALTRCWTSFLYSSSILRVTCRQGLCHQLVC